MSTVFTPLPQLGVDLTSVVVSGLAPSSTGVLTVGGYVTVGALPPNVYNVNRRTNVTGSPGHQEINAMNTQQRNQVITDRGYTLELQIFNVTSTNTNVNGNGNAGGANQYGVSVANDPSPLAFMWLNYDYFMVQWVEGSIPGSIYTNTFYGVKGDLEKPFEGRGEQLTTMRLLEMDPGVYSIAGAAVNGEPAGGVAQYQRRLTG